MCNALLLYPEFPNTFFLTYHILSNPKREYGGFKWDVDQCDWNWINTKERVSTELNDKNSKDVICYYGTSSDKINELPDGYKYKSISLPAYQPRFIFIPYDFDIYKEVYEKLELNTNGIITAKDISDYPDWDENNIKTMLSERGIQENIFSDTKDQALFIKEKLVQSCNLKTNGDQPIRLYYYGAPLTIFYLNHFPNYLPIKINYSAIHSDNNGFNENFKTFIHIYYRGNENEIDYLEKIIKNDVFSAYVDAILEPQLLTPVFRRFKEMVPRGQFYTMRDVNDFAKAITLHCSPEIKDIFNEINNASLIVAPKRESSSCHSKLKNLRPLLKKMHLIKSEQSVPVQTIGYNDLKDRQIKFLHDFWKRTSESTRNEDKLRVANLAEIKRIAFGCKLFLSVYLFEKRFKNSSFESMSSLDNVFINKLFKGDAAYFLYNLVVTCLAWEYVLTVFKCSHNDVSGAVLPNPSCSNSMPSNKNKLFFLRYKEIENDIIEKIYAEQPKVEEDGTEYDRNDIKKFIAYTEYIINKYVQDSLQNKHIGDKEEAYDNFSRLVNKSQSSKDTLLMILLRKIIDYRVYRYQQ